MSNHSAHVLYHRHYQQSDPSLVASLTKLEASLLGRLV